MSAKQFNIYCDESCHLENDGIDIMSLGAVYCESSEVRRISRAIRGIKDRHGIARKTEIKWTKVSNGQVEFYREVLAFFLNDPSLYFRGIFCSDKSALDHNAFNQSHDDWYYKMYYFMLRHVFKPGDEYRVYLDIKDTLGASKVRVLHNVLCNCIKDFDHQTIKDVQQIRSHESPILQLTDLLIGAVTYENRGLSNNDAKVRLISDLKEQLGENVLVRTSAFGATKFNLFKWDAREEPNVLS